MKVSRKFFRRCLWRKKNPDSSLLSEAVKHSAGGDGAGFFLFVVAGFLMILMLLPSAMAVTSGKPAFRERILFNIPQQRADKALVQFAEQADVTFMFSFEEARGVTANRLKGRYTPEQAIEILLKNTALQPVFDREQGVLTITVKKQSEDRRSDDMNKSILSRTVATLAAILTGAGNPASAQTSSPILEEVIVTATKREQSLQDISAAVSSYDQERLRDAHISTLEELQVIAPGITITNDFNLAKVFIRGIGLNASVSGTDPAVALHVDGVVISRPEAQLGSLFDLERVEVVRGPQGTLYGRNAVGGSINLVTAKPTQELEGYGRVTVGNYDTLDFEGAVGGSLIGDTVLGRIAFKSQDRNEGFGVNPVTGNYVDDRNRSMARMHLQFLPSDNIDILLTGEWFHQNDSSGALKFSEVSFPNTPGFGPTAGGGGFAAAPRDLASDIDPKTDTESWAITGTTNWQVSDNFSIVNVTSYRDFLTAHTHDLDISAVVTPTTQFRDVFSEQFSSELRFHYDNDWISAVLGFFYLNEDYGINSSTLDEKPLIGRPGNLVALNNAGVDPFEAAARCNVAEIQSRVAAPVPIIPALCGSSDLTSEALAAFGQVVVNLGRFSSGLDDFSLKIGARYSYEDRFVSNPTTLIVAGGALVIVIDENTSRNQKSFNSLDPEVGLEWRPRDDLLLYYTYSEGFKSGTSLTSLGGADFIIDPESIENHEFGLRSVWMDGRLIANISGFFYDLTDQQVNKVLFDPVTNTTSTRFENASSATAKGIELEVFASPIDRLRFSASVSWLDAEFEDFETVDGLNIRNTPGPRIDPSTPPFDPLVEQLAGNRLRNSPEWSSNIHIEYDLPDMSLPKDGYLTLSTDISYKSEVFFTEFNTLREGADSVTTVDASLHYTSGDGHWNASFWVKNLTDELIPAGSFPIIGRIIGIQYLPPRTYGFTFGYNF